MLNKLPKLGRYAIVSISALAVVSFIAVAGSLTPPGSPSSTMKSLQEVYDTIAGTFDSTAILQDQNGSLMQGLKYISNNLFWGSSGSDIYSLNAGNVGIGTSSPTALLETLTSVTDGNTTDLIRLTNTAAAASGRPAIGFYNINPAIDYAQISASPGGSYNDSHLFFSVADSSQVLQDRMVIDASGNVGIGTVAPSNLLDVTGGNLVVRRDDDDAQIIIEGIGPQFVGHSFNGTLASPTAVLTDDYLINLKGRGYNGSDFNGATEIIGAASEDWTGSANGSYLSFVTTTTGTLNMAERMRIADNGYVGIGTSSPAVNLHVYDATGDPYIIIQRATQSQGEVGLALNGGVGGVEWAMYTPPSSNDLRFYDTADRLTIQTLTGNVGIGTTDPANNLDVFVSSTSGSFQGMTLKTTGSSVGSGYNFAYTGLDFGGLYSVNGAPGGLLLDTKSGTGPIRMELAGVDHFFLNTDGTVTLTNDQSSKTTVGASQMLSLTDPTGAAGSRTEIAIGYSGGSFLPAVLGYVVKDGSGVTNGDVYIATRGVVTDSAPIERLTVTAGGNVGIGTDSPDALLDVANDALIYGLTIGRGMGAVNTNSAMGYQALFSDTIGFNNSAMGYQALTSNTTGDNNSALGSYALTSNTGGSSNTAMGHQALFSNISGNNNTALGQNTLYNNISGSSSIAIGLNALFSNTTGGSDIAIGEGAMQFNTTGIYNVAVGLSALALNASGSYNIAVGPSALYSNISGDANTAVGWNALTSNATGSTNSALGNNALYSNISGNNNSAMGYKALQEITTGSNNNALGSDAGRFIADGSTPNQTSNTSLYLGTATKALADGDTNETVIGYNAIGLGSDTVVLGNSSIVTTALRGNVGIGTTLPGTKFEVVGAASASQYFGGGLPVCNGSLFLQWTAGLFGCGTPIGSSGISVREFGGSFTNVSSLSFSESAFNVTNASPLSSIALDYINGPASRSIDQTITGAWTFNARTVFNSSASISGNFDPGIDNTYSLGSPDYRWKDINVGPGSFNLSSTTGTSGAGSNYTLGQITFGSGSSLSFGTSAVGSGSTGTLALLTAGTPRLYIGQSGNVGVGTTDVDAKLEIAGIASASEFTSPGTGVDSEKFGLGALAAGARSLAIGKNADVSVEGFSSGQDSIVVGYGAVSRNSASILIGNLASESASTVAGNNIIIGNGAKTQQNSYDNLVIGLDAQVTNSFNSIAIGNHSVSNGGTAIGASAVTNFPSIVIGKASTATAVSQFVAGALGDSVQGPIEDVYFGTGVISTTPYDYTIHGTSGSGTDISGASLSFAGGQPTGAGIGGNITFSTAQAGSSGTTLRSLNERMRIDQFGNIGIGTTSPTQLLEAYRSTDGEVQSLLYNPSDTANAYAEYAAKAGTIVSYLGASPVNYGSFGAGRSYISTAPATGTGFDIVAYEAAGDLRFYAGGYAANKERMRIDSAGNVGIGTTNIDAKFEIAGTASASMFTSPGTGANSEKFGFGAQASSSDSVVIGKDSKGYTGAGKVTLIGYNSSMHSINNTPDWIIIGAGTNLSPSTGGGGGIFIGDNITGVTSNLSQAIGIGHNVVAKDSAIVIGYSATNTSSGGISIGASTVGTGVSIGSSANTASGGIAIGGNTNAGTNNGIAIGPNAKVTDQAGVAIGESAQSNGYASIALGSGAHANTANIFVAGASTGARSIDNVYFGKGASASAPTLYTINGTAGVGTDIGGGDIGIAGGQPTGAGAGGSIIFSTAQAGASGTTLRSLSERMRIDQTGNVGIGATNIDAKFEVVGAASASQYFSGGLSTCNGSDFLQWTGGLFGCGTPTGGGSGTMIGVREFGGSFTDVSSLSFSESAFNVTNASPLSSIALDYINGPASRSISQTISGSWTFTNPTYSALFTGGNVGIGTTTPGYKLEVAGSTFLNGAVTIGGSGNGLTFNGGGTNVIQSSGTLQLNAFTLGGTITGGSNNITGINQLTATTANITTFGIAASISGDFDPSTDNTYSLGSNNYRWESVNVGPGSFNITSTTGTGGAGASYTLGQITFGSGSSLSFGTSAVGGGNAGSLALQTAGTPRFYIAAGGNIGIGTTSPRAILNITGDLVGNGKSFFTIASASNTRLAVLENGLVGIGTASASADPANTKLEVRGTTGLITYSGPSYNDFTAETQGYIDFGSNVFASLDDNNGAGRGTSLMSVAESNDLTQPLVGLYGFATSTNTSSGTKGIVAIEGDAENTGSGGLLSVHSINTYVNQKGSGNVSEMTGLYVGRPDHDGSGTVGSNYGIFIDDQTGIADSVTENYALYSTSGPFVITASGSVGIGTTAPQGLFSVGSGANNLRIDGSGTLFTQSGFITDQKGDVPSQRDWNWFTKDSNLSGFNDTGDKLWNWSARGDAFASASQQNDLMLSKFTGGGPGTADTVMVFKSASNDIRPGVDNEQNFGTSSYRWMTLHATDIYGTTHAGPDVAERYPSSDSVEAGDVVMLDPNPPPDKTVSDQSNTQVVDLRGGAEARTGKDVAVAIKKADGTGVLFGVISTAPGVIMSDAWDKTNPPVALTGRVPVRVSLENGPIAVGDRLTVGSVPGVAVKATKAGMTVGIALEPFSTISSGSYDTVLAFVNMGYWAPDAGSLTSAVSIQNQNSDGDILAAIISYLKDAVLQVKKLVAGTVQTKSLEIQDSATGDMYCVRIVNGEWDKQKGSCSSAATTPPVVSPSDTPGPSIQPSPSDMPEPSPSDTPVPTPSDSPTPTPTPDQSTPAPAPSDSPAPTT